MLVLKREENRRNERKTWHNQRRKSVFWSHTLLLSHNCQFNECFYVSVRNFQLTNLSAFRLSSHSFHSYDLTMFDSMKCVSVCVPLSHLVTGASIIRPGSFPWSMRSTLTISLPVFAHFRIFYSENFALNGLIPHRYGFGMSLYPGMLVYKPKTKMFSNGLLQRWSQYVFSHTYFLNKYKISR